jgi:hypothetical protein
MKTWSVLAFGAVLFAFAPSFADDAPAATTAAPTAPAKDDGDEMICRRVKLTGTNLLGPKICKPKKLWQQQHQDSQDMLNQTTQKALLNQPPGG